MKKMKMTPLKGIALLLLLVTSLGVMAGCNKNDGILEVPPEEEYSYINPDETKAETDAGFVIDGILDEEAYKKNNWLYLHNDDGGNNVNIAMTSHFGQKGMYFVFDVTESVPIYVNLERASYMNSCIEIYLSAPHVTSMRENDVFEIDLLPTGDMLFKRSNGRDGYSNVATTDDIMACLGTTTKGGAVNTADCYGYCMELFIPWDYLRWLKMDVEAIQNGYVYVNPAHITSYNHNGTDTGIDRYWYHYVQQNGVSFSNVSRHFRFNGQGVMGSVPVTLQQGEHYTLSGASAVIPGMNAIVTVKPDEGYALTSIMLNGEEQIRNVSFNEDGSVTLTILGTNNGAKVSAKAEAVTEGTKTLSGKIVLNNISKDSLDGLLLTYIGPKGEKPLEPDADGKFALKDLEQGYYILRAEKEGYRSVSRSIYLNQDFDTELVLECDFFRVTLGNAWILDEQNDGVLYKKDGEGQVLSNTSYNSFTFRANLKYDLTLAGQGTADSYTQQRSGMQIRFSNGKSWHINMLKEKGKYILQYAKISGNNSVTGWQTIHTLSAGQIGRYTSKDGIQLSVMRQGNYAAIWLGDELIKIEILDTQYRACSAQLGLESWASNRELLKIPFSIQNQSALNLKDLPILDDSKPYYDDFTFRATLKFNPSVAVLGTGDEYTQQRTGMQIRFRDGKSWHIDLLQEKGNYILQYAKISGENSLTNWQTVHTLDEEQIKRYTGKSGIELCVMRQGNYAAVWLDDQLIKIEILDEKYDDLSAQLALETWAYNQGILDIPFRIENHATVDVKGSPFLAHAKTWNISGQYKGKLYKQGTEGVYTVLESVIVTNDVTTVATDLSPDTKDYSLAYLFKFSNGEQFRVRLHHTDNDGVYRIQTMNGSTVVPAWKVGYALTEEQAAKVMTGGIEFRVQLSDTSAYVYLDGQEVCTYDLSKNLASGQPSGVDKATAKVGFSLDGNYGRTTELPFKLADVSKDVKIYVTDVANGIITANKESCKIGETVTLTIAGNPGCYYNEICINGEKIDPAWDGTYSYKATENIYIVTGSFAPGDFRENKESAWNVLKQNQNLLYMQAHTEGDSGWLNAENNANDISATVRDASADAKNFAMIYHFDFSNGETLRLRLHHTDSDGKYRIQVMDNSTVSEQWKSHYTLTNAEAAKVQGDGIKFRTWIDGTNAVVYLDGNPVCTIDLAKVLSTGNASGVGKATVRIKIKMDGNLNQAMEIPFKLTDTGKQVFVNIESLSNGNVTTNEASYQVGDTVVLTITPDAGYSQKLYINGEPLLLDWKTNTYSFTATEEVYDITGTFEPSLNITPKDIKRWDTANQAHGILNAYYPSHSDAWLIEIQDEYRSISVMAKNYLPGEDGTGVEGFAVNLGFKLSNGKEYIFRIIKEKGKYYHQRFGNDWKKTELDAAAIEALCGDGVNFKLERTSTSTLTLSVNGVVYDNYIMAGVTADTKVTTAIIGHYGNKGEKIALPFVLKTPEDTVNANLNIAETRNGTVTAGQENYQVGDTVILTVTPDAGYALKNLVVKKDGQPVAVSSNYSFVIEDGVYTVEAEFVASMFKIVSGNWDLSNQYNGSLTILKQKDGTTVKTNADNYRGVSVKVKEYTPSLNEDGTLKKGNFSAQISFIFDNGKQYQVRIHNTDDGNYKLQNMGGDNSITGWKWQADLTTAQKEKLINGDGVEFGVKLVGPNAELWVDGTRMKVVELGAEYAGKTAQISVCLNGNTGVENMEVPFALVTPTAPVQLNVAELTGGTVTVDSGYQVGDTIPVTVKADAGYSQKLYINGQPLLLGGNTNTYSFVATEEVYNITGSFAPDVFSAVKGNWSLNDQQHGELIITSQKDGTTVQTNAGDYKEVSVTVKDYTPSKNEDGSLKQGNFSMQVAMIFDDGKYYEVRIHNTNADGNYKLQNVGGANNLGGSGWPWLADLTTAQKAKLLDGDGVEFAVRLVDSKAELWVDGTRMKVIELGQAYEGKLAKVKLCMNGNTGVQNLHIPYELKTAAAVELNVAELTNGTVIPENDKYQVGDTVFMTVNADAGYSQKLYINGEPLLLDVGSNVYSFVATEEVYNITGSFESDLFSATSGNWDLGNQNQGVITIVNKTKDGSTVITNANNYKEVAVTVKDYTPSRNEDGSLKQGNFSMQVAMIFDDGKYYEVRIHNTNADGNYKLQNVGGANNLGGSGWPWLADLTTAQKAKLLDGDGVEFAVKLVGPNAELWVDGSRMKVVELGAEYEGKLAQISLCMNGNKNGQNIVIPFELKVPEEPPTVKFNIPELANGTVTPGYDAYKVGETVTLAVAANAGYSQKLYINGEPLMLDWQSNTCSFVATEAVYNITGSFEPSITFTSTSKWNVGNQAHGVLDTYYASGDSGWLGIEGGYDSITVTAKNYLLGDDGTGANGFAVLLGFKMSNGKTYTFRIIKENGVYYCQRAGFAKPEGGNDWTKKKLDEAAIAAINGDGAEFKVERTAANVLTISVNGIVYDTYTMADTTEEVTVTKGYIGHYGNVGQNITMPFTLDETK